MANVCELLLSFSGKLEFVFEVILILDGILAIKSSVADYSSCITNFQQGVLLFCFNSWSQGK